MTVILKILSGSLPRHGAVAPRFPSVGQQLQSRARSQKNVLHHSISSSAAGAEEDTKVKKLKIMFFGTDQFAVESLQKLHQELRSSSGCISRLEVTCLQMKSLKPAVSKFAEENNLNVHLWPPDTDLIRKHFDLGVVASFGKLIPGRVIESFPEGMINVHGSLLPRWRGAAPVIHALKNGDTKTGVTIMRVKPHKFDMGEMLATTETNIDEDIIRPDLTSRLATLGANLLVDVLRNFHTINKEAIKQDDSLMTLAPLVDKNVAVIDWAALTCTQVYNLWRAVGDLVKLRTRYQETGHTVMVATVLHPKLLDGAALDPGAEPGTLAFIRRSKRDKFVCVKCAEGWVAVSDIYYHNKKVMKPIDFYNGWLSRPGSHKFI